jgi:hypothetical protein
VNMIPPAGSTADTKWEPCTLAEHIAEVRRAAHDLHYTLDQAEQQLSRSFPWRSSSTRWASCSPPSTTWSTTTPTSTRTTFSSIYSTPRRTTHGFPE